jgi:TolB-like protein/class 3 adenylate cyclase/Tfp pilus assembly protein PilF
MISTAPAPESATIVRRLAAVAFADVVGFSALIERNDAAALQKWKDLRRELIEPKIEEHHGRIMRMLGDGMFIEFGSAVDAVRCAQEIQRGIAQLEVEGRNALRLRIGINVEDVIVDDGDLHGDGVNIAARIQQLASPGEVVVTSAVREYVWNKLGAKFTDLGERELKNISRPVRIYRLESPILDLAADRTVVLPYLTWMRRPTIAVLPFRNLGNDPREAYFGEGITEDIITGLSRSRSFFVIARHSTLPYRDRQANAREIASDLGVRYILDGSVRRQDARLRISAELIDAGQNHTIWAERYEGSNDDLFDFQDRIATGIVSAMGQKVLEAETARVRIKPTESLDAYDCVLRALALFYKFDDEDFFACGRFLDRAIELDPSYAQAYAYKAWWFNLLIGESRSKDVDRNHPRAEESARKASELDPHDAFVLAVAAHIRAFVSGQPEAALEMFERSLHEDVSSSFAWGMSAATCSYLGRPEDALDRLRNVWRLSPFDPLNFVYHTNAGIAEFVAGRYEEAIVWLQRARRENPKFFACRRTLAAAHGMAGHEEEAQQVGREMLAVDPAFRIGEFVARYPLRRPDDLNRYGLGLRRAGLPE